MIADTRGTQEEGWSGESIAKQREEKLKRLDEGVKAYEKAVLIDANCAALYYDLAINRYFHALVLDTHLPDTDAKESGAWAIRVRSVCVRQSLSGLKMLTTLVNISR